MNLTKNSTKFNSIVKELASSLFKKKLKEITTTGDIAGYETPNAFGKTSKKKKKNLEKQTGYKFVSESIEEKDLKVITKLIRNVVGDILRDIWLKRNAWK